MEVVAFFVTQMDLLDKLRETYRNRYADDIVERCQNTSLLVLDEIGLSGGGRDEFPMLHSIMSHRIGARLKTVITGNVKPSELVTVFGERVVDRLRESSLKPVILTGASYRIHQRAEYLKE